MSAYFLLACESLVAVASTVTPEAIVCGLASADMNKGEMRRQLGGRREALSTSLPLADVFRNECRISLRRGTCMSRWWFGYSWKNINHLVVGFGRGRRNVYNGGRVGIR